MVAKGPKVIEDVDIKIEMGRSWFFNHEIPKNASGKGYVRTASEPFPWSVLTIVSHLRGLPLPVAYIGSSLCAVAPDVPDALHCLPSVAGGQRDRATLPARKPWRGLSAALDPKYAASGGRGREECRGNGQRRLRALPIACGQVAYGHYQINGRMKDP